LSYLKDAGFVPAELKERYPVTQRCLLSGVAAARGIMRLVELFHPVIEAGLYDAPAGTALILANFTSATAETDSGSPLDRSRPATVRQGGGLSSVRGQGYDSVAVFTTHLGLNDIILLE
jgi:hypothetical protein